MKTGVLSAVAAVFALASASAFAVETSDQSQPRVDPTNGYAGLGGSNEQQLAQTFTAGVTGDLVALNLPVGSCAGGDLVIEIRETAADGSPTGALLHAERLPAASVPLVDLNFNEFRLSAPVPVRAGVSYAITLRMDLSGVTSYCNYKSGPTGDTYAGGASYFQSTSNPPGWVETSTTPGDSYDLPFETIVDVASTGAAADDCLVAGFGSVPIPGSTPVCRCLRDAGLREFRCALLHPDFFAIRRIPWPLPDEPFAEIWEFHQIAPLDGPVRLTLSGGGLQKPATKSFGLKKKPGGLGGPEKFVVKGVSAKALLADPEAIALFEYDMKDAPSDLDRKFGVDRSIDPDF